MFKIREKIQEVEFNIENLKKTARKHYSNKNFRSYKIVCEVILDNQKRLQILNKDLRIHDSNILFREPCEIVQ